MSKNFDKLTIKELDIDMIQPMTSTYKQENQGGSKIVVIGKPGCFAKGTQILTYNGNIINVENVKVNDLIMGDDSTPRKVLELCRNYDSMYTITFLNNSLKEKITVNSNHILVLKVPCDNINDKYKIIKLTVNEYLQKSIEFKNSCKWFKNSVNFQEKNLYIKPYTLGTWLSNNNTKVLDSNIIDNIKNKYDLSEKNIFIPFDYKINSFINRTELLAGIIDFHSNFTFSNNTFIIKDSNFNFLKDIEFVARSLGLHSNILSFNDNYYTLVISGNLSIIPSIKIDTKYIKNQEDLTYSFEIVYAGNFEYYGFTLDNNHKFLLSDFSVVHNTGKTTLISSLLYAKKHIFPTGMVMSGSEDSNHYYRKLFPSTFVYNSYDEEIIKSFIKRQKLAKDNLDNPWSVLLLDDCTDDEKVFNKTVQKALFKKGRHWKILYILSLQYAMDIKPAIRVNVDGTFILREPSVKIRKTIWENYASVVPDFTLFCQLMDKLTDDYTAIYINNQTTSNKMEDCIFWYKANLIPNDFKFGSDDFWDFHYERYNPEYKEPLLES
jgi:hypothetical protein